MDGYWKELVLEPHIPRIVLRGLFGASPAECAFIPKGTSSHGCLLKHIPSDLTATLAVPSLTNRL